MYSDTSALAKRYFTRDLQLWHRNA